MKQIVDEVTLALQTRSKIRALILADRADTIRKRSPFSQCINDHIHSGKELDLYLDLGLQETKVTRPALAMDIDPYFRLPSGDTNADRMAQGKAPYDATTGTVIDLHHIGQQYDAPYAELPHSIHDAPGIHSVLHRSRSASWRNNPKLAAEHNNETIRYWKQRGEELCRSFSVSSTTTNVMARPHFDIDAYRRGT